LILELLAPGLWTLSNSQLYIYWCCSVSMVWVQIPWREEQKCVSL